MFGLSVRWSLVDCAPGVPEQLRAYVIQTSLGRFSGMPGLHTKTWRMRSGEWFGHLRLRHSGQPRGLSERFQTGRIDCS